MQGLYRGVLWGYWHFRKFNLRSGWNSGLHWSRLEVEIAIRNIPRKLTNNDNGVKVVTLENTKKDTQLSDVKNIETHSRETQGVAMTGLQSEGREQLGHAGLWVSGRHTHFVRKLFLQELAWNAFYNRLHSRDSDLLGGAGPVHLHFQFPRGFYRPELSFIPMSQASF